MPHPIPTTPNAALIELGQLLGQLPPDLFDYWYGPDSDADTVAQQLAAALRGDTRRDHGESMTDHLPHDEYMAAVADALAAVGFEPAEWWTAAEDDRLDAVFQWDTVSAEHWPHGVYLGWDQHNGWQLIQTGGPRNVDRLSPDSRTYSDPRQVAADTRARLTHGLDGWTPGPITITGDRWDDRATRAAVEDWEKSVDGPAVALRGDRSA